MAFTVAGCILGAGYVSGRELWQYFGIYGIKGMIGVIVSLSLISIGNMIIIDTARKSGKQTIDEVAIRFNIPWLHSLVGAVCNIFYYITATIMIAGIGSLFNQLLGIPKLVGMILSAFIIMFCVYFGISLMVRMFEVTIPVLVVAAILISIIRIATQGTDAIRFVSANAAPEAASVSSGSVLLGNWFVSALNYACLNLFAGIGILSPVAMRLRDKKSRTFGTLIGGAFLLGIALAILLSLSTSRTSTFEDLPMLDMAKNMGSVYSVFYSILLFIAMIGNGIATMNAITNHLEIKNPKIFCDSNESSGSNGDPTSHIKKRRLALVVALGIVSLIIAEIGFARLIAGFYPIMGYFSIAMIILAIEHRSHLK